jgi:hypothetical protein
MTNKPPKVHFGYRSNDEKDRNQTDRLINRGGSSSETPELFIPEFDDPNHPARRQTIFNNDANAVLLKEIASDIHSKNEAANFKAKVPRVILKLVDTTATAQCKLSFTFAKVDDDIKKITAFISLGTIPTDLASNHKEIMKSLGNLDEEHQLTYFQLHYRKKLHLLQTKRDKLNSVNQKLTDTFEAAINSCMPDDLDLLSALLSSKFDTLSIEMKLKQHQDSIVKQDKQRKAAAAKEKRIQQMPTTPDELHSFVKKLVASKKPKPKSKKTAVTGKGQAAPLVKAAKESAKKKPVPKPKPPTDKKGTRARSRQ